MREDVSYLMQKTSHLTRAYFINENKLQGFIFDGILEQLRKAHRNGKFNLMIKYLVIDILDVLEALENLSFEKDREELLDKKYPHVYVQLLKIRGMNKEAEKYI